MDEITVHRTGLGPLVFHGRILAESSSRRPGKDRWTDLELYRTVGGNYITVIIGNSTRPSDEIIRSAHRHADATAAVRSFCARDAGRMSLPAINLLDNAAGMDEAIAAAYDALEDEVERIK